MAKVTRSGGKLKDEDSNNSRRKQMSGSTTDTSGLRRSTRGTPSKKQSASSSSSTRKSERLEKLSPQTPSTKRKSERVENQTMPQLRRSDRNDKHNSLNYSGSKKFEKGSSSSITKRKTEKRAESEKNMILDADVCTSKKRKDLKPVRVISKKKRLDARRYRAFLKPQGNNAKEPDLIGHGDSENTGDSSKEVEDELECSGGKREEPRGEDLGEDYKTATEGSCSGLKEVEDEGECSEGKGEEVGGRHFGEGYKSAIKGTSSSCKEFEDEGECNEGIGEETRRIDLREGCKRDVEGSTSSSVTLVKGILKNHGKVELSYFTRKHKNHHEEAPKSKNEDGSAVLRYGEGSLQSSPNAIKAKEAIADRVQVDYPAREDLQKSESMGSPSVGKSVTGDHDLERAEKVRKRLDIDFNASVVDDGEKICTSTVHAISSSSQGSKESNPIERCVSCSKRQRVDLDSQHFGFCSCCLQRTRDDASFPEEVCEQSSSVRSPQTDEMTVNCILKQRSRRDVDLIDQQREASADLDGCKLLLDDGSKVVHDQTDSPGILKISIPVEEDGMKLEDMVSRGPTEKSCPGAQLKSSSLDIQSKIDQNACVVCKLGGKLLCCDGKGCRKSYHLYCLDPPLQDVPPGVWYCLLCVRKRMESGVHSVSGGEESIWDAKEVKLSDSEGIQKQYLVKYQGLAHVHNRWVPERQLLLSAPALVAKFKKNQVLRWKSEWTVPHRLLQKRLLMSPKQRDEYLGGHTYKTKNDVTHLSSQISNCHYEWFVKWRGLGYEHATWELENAQFLQVPEILTLIKDYESRRTKAKLASDPSRADKVLQEKSGPCLKLSRLPVQSLPGFDNDHLCFVNKLRECWHKGHNAVVMEDQERVKVILFILSLQSAVCRPFLIISSSATLSTWESEFMRLAPSVNLVVYNGNKDVRETIRMLEFYEEDGSTMFEVLLSHPDAIVEDLKVLECLGWEAIVVDECQRSSVSKHFKQIKMLTSDSKVLLVTGPIKDSMAEYLNLLSFLDSRVDGNNSEILKVDSNDNIGKLKERFARFVVSGRKIESSQFVEYWVPVSLSNVQLEQYCSTLLSNSMSLRSCSKQDPVGALRDILISTRKCCDHPYIVDPSLQSSIAKGLPVSEILDVGVNASGKLQVLDKILSEILKRGLRALILFQSIGGTGRNYIGDILDDFLRQRFGADSYERVDSGLVMSKKQTALNMFNDKERGRFVFLIENRACLPSIKLSSVDIVILFDSDWNPLNDLRALQKITIDSEFEQIKVFRLYSSCTLEEKVLVLAKQDMTLDSSVQNINCSTSHMLLKWGASFLFKKLDEFHQCTPSSGSVISSEQSLLNDVVRELLAQLPQIAGKRNTSDCSIIVKAKQSGLTYSSDISLHGELDMHSIDVEQPHVFWTRLLEGRSPQWRFLSEPSQRVRKRVQYFHELPETSEVNDDDIIKKRKRVVNNTFDPTSRKTWVEDDRKAVSVNNEAGASDTPVSNGSQVLPRSTDNIDVVCLPTGDSEVTETHMVESEERKHLCESQKNLHLFLKPEISKLCEILRLSEDIKGMTGKFLEYVMNNHQVSREPATVLQAFQISLCWTAASLLKQKVNRKETLILAKQHLNFECKDEEAEFVYSRLRKLKKLFSQRSENAMESSSTEDPARTTDGAEHVVHARGSQLAASDQPVLEGEIRESSQGAHCSDQQISAKQELVTDSKQVSGNPTNYLMSIGQVKKIHSVRMGKLFEKQMEEITKFNEKNSQIREKLKARLEKEHKIESALIRAVHSMPVRSDKLKAVDRNFATKMEELSFRIEKQKKRLEAMQLAARIEEKKRKSHWLEEAKSGRPVAAFSVLPLPDSGFRLEDMESGEQVRVSDGPEEVTPISGPLSEKQDTEGTVTTVPGEAVVAEAPKVGISDGPEEVTPISGPSSEKQDIEGPGTTVPGEAVVAEDPKVSVSDGPEEVTPISGPSSEKQGIEGPGTTVPGEAVVAEAPKVGVSDGPEEVTPISGPSSKKQDIEGPGTTVPGEAVVAEDPVRVSDGPEEVTPISGPSLEKQDTEGIGTTVLSEAVVAEAPEPLAFPLHSHNENDGRYNTMTSDGEFEQHGSTTGATDSGCSPSLEQTRLSSPFGQQHVSAVQDSGVPSFQDLPIEESQQFVSDGLQAEDSSSRELQNSSLQVEVSLLPPPTVPSSSGHNQPGAPASTVVENSVNHVKLVGASPQFQLPPQPSAMVQTVLFDLSVQQPETQLEPEHQLSHASSQQSQVVTQLPAENQIELFNHCVPQSETEIERDHQLRHTPSQQAQVPIQLPESEVSTQPPARDQAGPLDHIIPPLEMQLEHGHLLRDTCSQQLQMQPPAEVYAELHNVLQSNTQPQLHTSVERPSSGSGIRMPETRSLGVVPESRNRPPHTAPVTPRISQPDPLQTELARIRKEQDQVMKIHEDLKTRINSECEKEIEEIRRKYNTLRQDAETAFVQKRKALETFHNRVYMNMVLAEVFRFKCSEPRATGALGLQQGAPPEFVQQLLQMSSQQNAQRPVSASGPPVAPSSSPPIQLTRHSSALFSSNMVRPPYSSASPLTGNYQVGGEVRAAAPDHQSFRPSSSMSVPNHHYPSSAMLSQQSPSIPTANSMLPHLTTRTPTYSSGSSLTAGGFSVSHNSSLMHEMPRSIDNGPSLNLPNLFTPLQGLGLTLDTPELAVGGNLRGGSATRVGISADVVCLSDDD